MAHYGSKGMSISCFIEHLKKRGCTYNSEKGFIANESGKRKSKITRNGYYTLALQIENEVYTFCEHRVVWWWHYPDTDESLVIDHIDCDRGNNLLENLEAVSQKENSHRTVRRGRGNPARGEKNGKTKLTNREAKAIRFLSQNGWSRKAISDTIVKDKAKHARVTVNRIIEGTRFGAVPDAKDIWEVYPLIVMATARTDLPKDEQIKNALMGMCGEIGEVVDLFKKHYYHGHELDVDAMIDELGDVIYYATWLSSLCFNLDRSEIMLRNMDKINSRYPDGFSPEASINRAV